MIYIPFILTITMLAALGTLFLAGGLFYRLQRRPHERDLSSYYRTMFGAGGEPEPFNYFHSRLDVCDYIYGRMLTGDYDYEFIPKFFLIQKYDTTQKKWVEVAFDEIDSAKESRIREATRWIERYGASSEHSPEEKATEPEMVKIRIPLPEAENTPAAENCWAEVVMNDETGETLYRIDNLLWYCQSPCYHDLVRAVEIDGVLTFQEVAIPGEYFSLCINFLEERRAEKLIEDLCDRFKDFELSFEGAVFPAGAIVAKREGRGEILSFLSTWRALGMIEYGESLADLSFSIV